MTLQSIKWENGKLEILDQLLLPAQSKYIEITGVKDGWTAIHRMQVRGAPAIAIVGCLSLAVEIFPKSYDKKEVLIQEIGEKLDYLVSARPTAVNINLAANELKQLMLTLSNENATPALIKEKIISRITSMLKEDIADNKAIGEHGAKEIIKNQNNKSVTILTHCNTGSLATAGYGTALGIIRSLYNNGNLEHVYCTETRPYNQGARLTAYELVHDRIPSTLICDDMVGSLMKTKNISAVVIGADRIVANGDTANKIGTYQIAILAKYHSVPFYIAAPFTTIDFSLCHGDEIKIEERPQNELTEINGVRIAAENIQCWNPSFDVTPADLISGIITEKGVFKPSELVTLKK
ncbi:PREDICTED: methylthioribose-1-phosphate isomerase [Ceratosolen solmsi marchali]|uniref:Methylthioribose-1-phosphate isomerase n=1 Tax=Ceratosolen solmsi marchali TaxID=326594 RepID=A0AAJ6YDY6_9HYME|nr:PREDICTED: methylthioribose-1-phosphate isomerase [Ceratosolen solmsi marchali]